MSANPKPVRYKLLVPGDFMREDYPMVDPQAMPWERASAENHLRRLKRNGVNIFNYSEVRRKVLEMHPDYPTNPLRAVVANSTKETNMKATDIKPNGRYLHQRPSEKTSAKAKRLCTVVDTFVPKTARMVLVKMDDDGSVPRVNIDGLETLSGIAFHQTTSPPTREDWEAIGVTGDFMGLFFYDPVKALSEWPRQNGLNIGSRLVAHLCRVYNDALMYSAGLNLPLPTTVTLAIPDYNKLKMQPVPIDEAINNYTESYERGRSKRLAKFGNSDDKDLKEQVSEQVAEWAEQEFHGDGMQEDAQEEVPQHEEPQVEEEVPYSSDPVAQGKRLESMDDVQLNHIYLYHPKTAGSPNHDLKFIVDRKLDGKHHAGNKVQGYFIRGEKKDAEQSNVYLASLVDVPWIIQPQPQPQPQPEPPLPTSQLTLPDLIPRDKKYGEFQKISELNLPTDEHLSGPNPSLSMVQSVQNYGVLEPLIVIDYGHSVQLDNQGFCRYEVADGRRRLKAARMARLDKVPCIVFEKGYLNPATVGIVKNVHRSRNPVSEMQDVRSLLAAGYDTSQLEHALRVKEAVLEKMAELDRLPAPIKASVERGYTKPSVARSILRLPEEAQAILADRIERRVAARNTGQPLSLSATGVTSADVREVKDLVTHKERTLVEVFENGQVPNSDRWKSEVAQHMLKALDAMPATAPRSRSRLQDFMLELSNLVYEETCSDELPSIDTTDTMTTTTITISSEVEMHGTVSDGTTAEPDFYNAGSQNPAALAAVDAEAPREVELGPAPVDAPGYDYDPREHRCECPMCGTRFTWYDWQELADRTCPGCGYDELTEKVYPETSAHSVQEQEVPYGGHGTHEF